MGQDDIRVKLIVVIPQTSFSLWGSYLAKKEVPTPFPTSKLQILDLFSCFTFKTNEVLRQVFFC
jgi:hypothetical protein